MQKRKEQLGIKSLGDLRRTGAVSGGLNAKLFVQGRIDLEISLSNITARQIREFRSVTGQPVEIHIGTYIINDLVGSYSQGHRQSPSALINSGGNLEIFLQEESAARCLQFGVGEEVRLCSSASGDRLVDVVADVAREGE